MGETRLNCLAYIETNFACFGAIVENGIVIEIAPIAGWTKGKAWAYVKNYMIKKYNANIEEIQC